MIAAGSLRCLFRQHDAVEIFSLCVMAAIRRSQSAPAGSSGAIAATILPGAATIEAKAAEAARSCPEQAIFIS